MLNRIKSILLSLKTSSINVSSLIAMTLTIVPVCSYALEAADTVLTNARAYTVNKSQPWAQAVAIKNNRIVFVGSNDEVKAFVSDKTVVKNLHGKMVLPGFIDAHAHPALSGIFSSGLRLSAADDRETVFKAIKDYAEKNPHLPVIFGGGWSTMMFGEEGPKKEDLDRIVPDRPVILMGEWLHTAWLNTMALKIVGVDKNTPDPVPGVHEYKRDQAGNPTGWLKEMQTYTPALQRLEVAKSVKSDIYSVIKAYSEKMNQYGVTTVFDAGMAGFEDVLYPVLEEGMAVGDINYRIFGSYHVTSASMAKQAVTEVQRLAENHNGDRLKVQTVKLHQDGIYEAYTAGMLDDYVGRPGFNGNMILKAEEIKTLLLELDRAGLDLHVHSIGDRTTHETLNGVELAIKALGRPLVSRVTLCHVEFINDEDFKRFKELGVIANITPSWHNDSNADYVPIVGQERAENVLRVMPLITQGTPVAASSDGMTDPRLLSASGLSEINPLLGIESAYTRQALGNPDGTMLLPRDERIPLDKMIEAYTINGSIQLGLESEIGSLEVGKRADLVVLEKNLFEISKYEIHKVKVELTMMDGDVVYCRSCDD